MKQVNFITTLTPQQQYALRRWFIASALLICGTLALIVWYIAPQLYTLYRTKKEINILRTKTNVHAELVSQQTTLKKEYEAAQRKQTALEKYKNNPKNPYDYCAEIIKNCTNGVQLEQIRKNKKKCEIVVLCPSTDNASTLINNFAASSHFSAVKLTHLQQDAQRKQFRCTITAMLQ